MVWRRRALAVFVFSSWAMAVACGRTTLEDNATDDSGTTNDAADAIAIATDATTITDATAIFDATVSSDAVARSPVCIPGQSVACVGPGGCSTNQICNGPGT